MVEQSEGAPSDDVLEVSFQALAVQVQHIQFVLLGEISYQIKFGDFHCELEQLAASSLAHSLNDRVYIQTGPYHVLDDLENRSPVSISIHFAVYFKVHPRRWHQAEAQCDDTLDSALGSRRESLQHAYNRTPHVPVLFDGVTVVTDIAILQYIPARIPPARIAILPTNCAHSSTLASAKSFDIVLDVKYFHDEALVLLRKVPQVLDAVAQGFRPHFVVPQFAIKGFYIAQKFVHHPPNTSINTQYLPTPDVGDYVHTLEHPHHVLVGDAIHCESEDVIPL
mmetsp:Transcript_19714/g.36668  ORF Transcript_19714/g.36668 Transcript_19714/m.36668 type:complete len:280 (+) Transcript_19714:443-1282(+)